MMTKPKLVASNKGFDIYFNAETCEYSVYKDGKLLVDKKWKYSQVKSYVA